MSETSTKKGFGVYTTLIAAVLSLAAGIYFKVINGTFGATNRNCFNSYTMILLIAACVAGVVLVAMRRYGLASALVTALSGVSLCFFVHSCYWYVSDVFVAIDEKGFDSKFLIFAGLAVAAFVLGEVSIYARKEKTVKA